MTLENRGYQTRLLSVNHLLPSVPLLKSSERTWAECGSTDRWGPSSHVSIMLSCISLNVCQPPLLSGWRQTSSKKDSDLYFPFREAFILLLFTAFCPLRIDALRTRMSPKYFKWKKAPSLTVINYTLAHHFFIIHHLVLPEHSVLSKSLSTVSIICLSCHFCNLLCVWFRPPVCLVCAMVTYLL